MHRLVLSAPTAAVLLFVSAAGFADKPITSMRIDGDFTRDVGNRCGYSASVHGTISPIKGSSKDKTKSAPAVEPKVDVRASVACPNVEAFKIADNVMATGPLTEEQLARALERRATVVVPGAKRCVYVPEFALSGGELKLQSVSSDCR